MSIENITIGQIEEILKRFSAAGCSHNATEQKKLMVGEYVIVRCRDAGVHAGILLDYEGRTVSLSQSRRLWRWHAVEGISLSDVAKTGLVHANSRINATVEYLTVMDACEIISVSDQSKQSIQSAPVAEKS